MLEVIGYEPRKCPIHGDYTCEIVQTPIGAVASKCGACNDDVLDVDAHRRAMDEAMQNHDERRRQHKVNHHRNNSGIPPKYQTRTFANYRADDERQAKAAGTCQSFADNFEQCQKTGASLILAGERGTGKTHLACAIGNQLIERGKSVTFLTTTKMLRRIRETYRPDSHTTEQQAIDALVRVDLLIIDEVGVQRGTESEEHLLFEVINERNGYYAPTILISNLPVPDVQKYIGSRAMDRMREGGGKLIAFDWESYRGKVLADAELPAWDGVRVEDETGPKLKPFPKDD